MFRSLSLAATLIAGAGAMSEQGARPVIGKSSGPVTRPNPFFGKAKVVPEAAPGALAEDMSLAIPFSSRPTKLNGALVGDVGFDPLGLSNLWDLNWLRSAELKHGRVGMLATTGFLVQVCAAALSRA